MHIALLVLVLLACPACTGVRTEEPLRAARPMFKGVELYSWLDPATRDWRFVFLPGTNRLKTPEEILAKQVVLGSIAEVKEHLSHLATGESVFWHVPDPKRFALPPAGVLNDIVKHAAASGVTVHVVDAS